MISSESIMEIKPIAHIFTPFKEKFGIPRQCGKVATVGRIVFEKEYMIKEPDFSNEPYTVEKSEEEEGLFIVEGPRIERMLGYTNLDSEKGFEFFQKFLKNNGILDELEKMGIEEGDTVKMYGWQFEYMR